MVSLLRDKKKEGNMKQIEYVTYSLDFNDDIEYVEMLSKADPTKAEVLVVENQGGILKPGVTYQLPYEAGAQIISRLFRFYNGDDIQVYTMTRELFIKKYPDQVEEVQF